MTGTSARQHNSTAAEHGAGADAGTGYVPALDGLRAFAALVVLGYHALIPGFAGGAVGVDVFFTLSGFLITAILLRDLAVHGRILYRRFYVRRGLRLLPAYLATLVAAVVCDRFVDVGGTLKGAFFSFFYVANWANAALDGHLGSLAHTWSLAVEEQFYLVWPAALALCFGLAVRRSWPLWRTLVVVIVVLQVLTVAVLATGVPTDWVWGAPPARAVELLAGALVAVGFATVRGRVAAHGRLVSAAGVVAALALTAYITVPPIGARTEILLGWPALALVSVVIIVSVLSGGVLARILSWTPLVAVGRRSYGLYLWHFLVLTTVDQVAGLTTWWPRLLGLAVTAVVVTLSYRYVEMPFLRLKDRRWGGAPRQAEVAETPEPGGIAETA